MPRDNWKEHRRQKNQFRSYYCVGCRQRKPCGLLTEYHSDWQGYCCLCYFQREAKRSQEYTDYQQIYQREAKEWKTRIQQLKLLRDYRGCKHCGSYAVDAYELLDNNKLVCRDCLIKQTGGAAGEMNWEKEQKWYQKRWGINISEWLDNYDCLPVNVDCAKKWLKNKEHLSNCACLAEKAKELYETFTDSLRKLEEKIKECRCETNEKVRVSNDYYVWCEKCKKGIAAASKKRVIKNRNDPRFWGLEVKEKVLCGNCLKNLVEQMPISKKYTFNKYVKRRYWE